jgi:hypothetical protein
LYEGRDRTDRVEADSHGREHGAHSDGPRETREDDQLNDTPHLREDDREDHASSGVSAAKTGTFE